VAGRGGFAPPTGLTHNTRSTAILKLGCILHRPRAGPFPITGTVTSAASDQPIPALLNPRAGNAAAVREAVLADGRFRLASEHPSTFPNVLKEEVRRGTPRVLLAGGDGTLATGAAALAHSGTSLAIVAAGTLNHFARSLDIPLDPGRALQVAAEGVTAQVDAGYVNDRLFLNTSSVGAYLDFVRVRERWKRRTGYYPASILAGLSTLVRLPSYSVSLEVGGTTLQYRTPLVFTGVGERDLRFPTLGERSESGRRGLHVIVTPGRSRVRLLATAVIAAARGARIAARAPYLDDFLLESCTVELSRGDAKVAIDGEIVRLASPLRYRLERGAVTVVIPPDGEQDRVG
jgi:diacylglycerol kinase family enzyme